MKTARETVAATKNVVLSGAKFDCTGPCGKTKTAKEFGFRTMADGKVRNQPQCIECRSLASQVSRAGKAARAARMAKTGT